LFADYALRHLTEWFGEPRDPDSAFEIIIDQRSVRSYDFLRRRYALFIRERAELEPMLGSVAHEMYHRVTCRRKRAGLHRLVWVDEVLACSASRKVLQRAGYHSYVEALVRDAKEAPKRLSIQELSKVRYWPAFAMLRPYPTYFAETVTVVGESLEEAIGWPNMCALISHRRWSDWLAGLSPIERKRIEIMFGDFPKLARW
jgi:hypothetical protein